VASDPTTGLTLIAAAGEAAVLEIVAVSRSARGAQSVAGLAITGSTAPGWMDAIWVRNS